MKVAFLTAGGIAPCLSASIGGLIERYLQIAPDTEMIGYLNGYQGLLTRRYITFTQTAKEKYPILYKFGGSPIGNSRVKLTNVKNCVERGLVPDGENPLHAAAENLVRDGVDVLHTIGGDDTNTTAADLAKYLEENGYGLTVVGMPKTIDNDVFPIRQTLGAWTAAEQGARFFKNISNEHTTSSRKLIIHEVMGRNCGWLAAATTRDYQEGLKQYEFLPEVLIHKQRWDVDAVWLPEMELDLAAEVERLHKRMGDNDGVNIFLSEGAGADAIVAEMEDVGETPPRDAFGHVRLDEMNVGEWFAKRLKHRLGADKVLVQKSGYFARSAAPNARDLELIKRCAFAAADAALEKISGVAGEDEDRDNELRIIEFPRIKGGKPFDVDLPWFEDLLQEIGQPKGARTEAKVH